MKNLYVQLGRFGDIINILPLLYREFIDSGEKPGLMVAKDFASILDGVSYVRGFVYNGPFEDTRGAVFQARQLTPNVIISQIYGNTCNNEPRCFSFARESWFAAGSPHRYGSLPLVFDRRSPERETDLLRRYDIPGKPLVLAALRGYSSPMPHAPLVMEELTEFLGSGLNVVDVSAIKAERIYDLLGLIERAHCLLTIDSALLHLSADCPVPVIALRPSMPSRWHASAWRPNWVASYDYEEISSADIRDKIYRNVENGSNAYRPSIVHVWSDRRPTNDLELARRRSIAETSWALEYANGRWLPSEFTEQHQTRSALDVGDSIPIPFHRDLIDYASYRCKSLDDVICWTNSDVSFAPGITGLILHAVRRYGCAFTHRWDFARLNQPVTSEAEIRRGKFYPGSDAFFFSRIWWAANHNFLPDVLIGRQRNDEVFRQLIKLRGGPEIEACIYHEKHDSFWERPENFESNPGNIHNRKQADKWFEKTWLRPNDYLWWSAATDRRTR